MKKTWGKRLLSGVTSAALMFSYMLSSSVQTGMNGMLKTNAVQELTSLNGDNPTTDVTLLVGKNTQEEFQFADTDAAVAYYNQNYLLGIASQFCVFLDGDFTVRESDAEGRVAVSGDLSVQTPWGSYVIGKGDFNEGTALPALIGDSEYARLILGGSITDGKLSNETNDEGNFARRIVLNTPEEIVKANPETYYRGFGDTSDYFNVGKSQVYASEILDIPSVYRSVLQSRSETLENEGKDDFDVSFDESSSTITLSYTGGAGTTNGTVYLTLSDEELDWYRRATHVVFKDVPNLPEPRDVVNNDGKGYTPWEYAYIVINIPQKNNTDDNNGIHLGTFSGSGVNKTMTINDVFIDGREQSANNNPGVSSILYNIPNASQVVIPGSMQGTILAPNAHVTDEKSLNGNQGYNPHLSGALIAKSFDGFTEFGYRPFTGPISMLGVESNYSIDLYKYITGTDELLDGATFGFFPVDDEGNVSEKPSEEVVVDNGHINYPITPGKYALKETKAPDGYDIDPEKVVYFEVVESGKTKTSLNTGSVFPENADVYTIGVDGFTQEMADSGEYTPAQARSYVYQFNDIQYSEQGNSFARIAWSGADKIPSGVKVDKFVLHYADGEPIPVSYTEIENESEDSMVSTDDGQYVYVGDYYQYYTYDIPFSQEETNKTLSYLAWGGQKAPDIAIDEIVVTYSDGSTDSVVSPQFDIPGNDWWNEIALGSELKMNDITNISVKMSGDVQGNADKLRLICEFSDNSKKDTTFQLSDCQGFELTKYYYKLADENEGGKTVYANINGIDYLVEAYSPERKPVTFENVSFDTSNSNWEEFKLALNDSNNQGVTSFDIVLSGDVESNKDCLKLKAQSNDNTELSINLDPDNPDECVKTQLPITKYYKLWNDETSPENSPADGGERIPKEVTVEGNTITVEGVKKEVPVYVETTYTEEVAINIYDSNKFDTIIDSAVYSPLDAASNELVMGDEEYEVVISFVENDRGGKDIKVTSAKINGAEVDPSQFSIYTADLKNPHYGLVYNDEFVSKHNGVYTIDGKNYEIKIDADGNITSVKNVPGIDVTEDYVMTQ